MAVALPVIFMAVAAAGTALSAYGTYQQGQQQKQAAEHNAAVATQNAAYARQKADYEEAQYREKAKRIMATQRVAYAKAGVDPSSGTPLDFLMNQAVQAEKDAQTIRYGGEVAATRYMSEADFLNSQASAYGRAGIIGAGATLLKGAGDIGMNYFGKGAAKGARVPVSYED